LITGISSSLPVLEFAALEAQLFFIQSCLSLASSSLPEGFESFDGMFLDVLASEPEDPGVALSRRVCNLQTFFSISEDPNFFRIFCENNIIGVLSPSPDCFWLVVDESHFIEIWDQEVIFREENVESFYEDLRQKNLVPLITYDQLPALEVYNPTLFIPAEDPEADPRFQEIFLSMLEATDLSEEELKMFPLHLRGTPTQSCRVIEPEEYDETALVVYSDQPRSQFRLPTDDDSEFMKDITQAISNFKNAPREYFGELSQLVKSMNQAIMSQMEELTIRDEILGNQM
jgi:hypothetical protein